MKASLKISCIALMIFILMTILCTNVKAANENLKIIKSAEDYIIYVEGYETTNFSFAFSNSKEPDMETIKFYKNWTDSNGINVACIDNQSKIDLANQVYMFITDEENNMIISAKELDLSGAIKTEEIESINNLTKRISVDSTQKNTTKETVDGIEKTKTSGKLVITDDASCTYRYNLQKITETSEAAKLEKLLIDLSNAESKTMVEKINLVEASEETLNNLVNQANWQNVSKMTINQPEESLDGEKYAVVLQKISNGNVVETDVQILKCTKVETQEKITETVPVNYTTMLPITGENLALYIIFGIVIVLIIAVIIRIAFLKSNKKNESK